MCFSLRSPSTISHGNRGICGDVLFDNADIVGARSQESHREVGETEQGPEGIPCQREPAKQVGREYGCPRVARSERGEEGRHDMTRAR